MADVNFEFDVALKNDILTAIMTISGPPTKVQEIVSLLTEAVENLER